jgi:DNA-binding GntR family transcriptional regulator
MSTRPGADVQPGTVQGQWLAGPVDRVAAPLRQRVLEILRQAILDFELLPGERLTERRLVEQLEVSRATIREVLARLASEGLVTVIPQRGAIVSVMSTAEAADMYEMRTVLEQLAVRFFVERATDAEIAELRGCVDEMAATVAAGGGPKEFLRGKDRFYEVLLAGARSPGLGGLITGLAARGRVVRAISLTVAGRPAIAVSELREVVEAVEAREAVEAAAACGRHLGNARKTGLARLAAIEDLPPTNGRSER